MRRKNLGDRNAANTDDPVRAVRVKCCHMCGAACGKVMCDDCGREHFRILQAQLKGRPFPRATESSPEDELTDELSPTQIPKEQLAKQKESLLRMDGKPASEEPPY